MTEAVHRTRHPAVRPATPKPKSGFEKWQDDIRKSDDSWDVYDCEIQLAVNEFNRHLSGKAGYTPLNWQLVKAMVWVETGANKELWKSNPIQIGMYNDPGLSDLLANNKGGELILPPRMNLSASRVRTEPAQNIRAGIGYLLMRSASFETRSVADADTMTYEVDVQPGDTIEKIANVQGSTVEVMKQLNPTVRTLRPGQTLKYRKASMRKVITRWMPLTSMTVATRYNTGDPRYSQKLDYAISVIQQRDAVACK
ncbi:MULTISPECIES: LysM domain-containing protein [unclassified Variovorax]|jgi:hypothetical protein|uniref:LysM peptidoglycan-binding domain-containing protein n=1 Tax=unclassified Variovorax TaxID=663243 RepID=UPI000F7DB827|nr:MULTISPECIES: LysM domain-containing protein [unclassified Variovorax]RSZ32289.1 LysM peptidoglycan-binding domain-containing protein [Variovorax sp. 553]RSZ32549.1 LysM peptidoglycan-binding domain-containing protein [Variovorax sp. 679]